MTKLTENIFAVEVPESSTDHKIIHLSANAEALQYYVPANGKGRGTGLPAGSWQLLCTTREATNGNAMGIVKSHYSRSASYNPVLGHYQTSGSSTTFMDYMNGHCTFDSPLDSLRSLLTSKGLDVNKNYVLLKKTT